MGFRTAFVSCSNYIELPDWFVRRWKEHVYMTEMKSGGYCTPIASKREKKTYSGEGWDNLCRDLSVVCAGLYEGFSFYLVYMHECGGIEKVEITEDGFIMIQPTEWEIATEKSYEHGDGCFHECDSVQSLIDKYERKTDEAYRILERAKLEYKSAGQLVIENGELRTLLAGRTMALSDLNDYVAKLESLISTEMSVTIKQLKSMVKEAK